MQKKALLLLFTIFIMTSLSAGWQEIAQFYCGSTIEGYSFGEPFAVDGDFAVVGVRYDDEAGAANCGSAYVYNRLNGVWVLQARLLAPDHAANDYFGQSVDINGSRIVVGAPTDNSPLQYAGSAYVFDYSGGTWNFTTQLKAPDAAYNDQFGSAVAVSGNHILCGAANDAIAGIGTATGSAYAFEYIDGSWQSIAKLTEPVPESYNRFGWDIAFDGDTAVISSLTGNNNIGAAYVYHFSGASWDYVATLLPISGASSDQFGYSVSIDGQYIVIGAPQYSNSDQGAAYVFHTDDNVTWTQQAMLTVPGGDMSMLGYSVDIEGDLLVAGAPFASGSIAYSGGAYIYQRNGVTWDQESTLFTANLGDGYFLGVCVAISSERVFTGAPYATVDGIAYAGQVSEFQYFGPGTGTAIETPADEDPVAVDVVPLEAYDYDGNGPVVVDPNVDINPDTPGATVTIDVVVTSGNVDPGMPFPPSLTYQISVSGTNDPVEVTLHYDGLPFDPTQIVWNNGGVWVVVPDVVWDDVNNTATFSWTFDTALRDGGEQFVMNDGVSMALPVELSSFSAAVTASNTVMIEWSTQSETDLLGYVVLRSETGDIGDAALVTNEIITAQNSTVQTDYAFEDVDVFTGATYSYWLQSIDFDGSSQTFGPAVCTVLTGGEDPDAPEVTPVTALEYNYPNPFNPSTTVFFNLAEESEVNLEVFNMRGQKVATLLHASTLGVGEHRAVWDATDTASGVYYARLTVNGETYVHKMLLIK